MAPFRAVLVANRGEIAIRVFRALRELGIRAVAVYSEADREALHVRRADDAYLIGPGAPAASYLAAERIVEAALRAGVDAVHPGYGFLAENAAFARAVEAAGLVWIGPPAEAIEAMGSKIAARELLARAGIPIVPGTTEPVESAEEVVRLGAEHGWPLAVKAAAGGGGKGLRVVRSPGEAERLLHAARREGEAYFADPTVYVERYIEDPRHVEVQVLADSHGAVVHLGERDCTIQRRHQKLVEESPSPAVDAELRGRIGRIALDAARAVGYRGAGTIEGLLDPDGNYYFLEMNTRIQVEHTVTEMTTGIDLVREQILIAAGKPLSVLQEDVRISGHALECRINAEDAASGFLPAPGVIRRYREPAGPGVRIDSGVAEGSEVSGLYDPLLAKLVVWDRDRESARLRMLRALDELVIEGVPTLIGFHKALLSHPCFVAGSTCSGLAESEELAVRAAELAPEAHPDGRAATLPSAPHVVHAEVDGRRFQVTLLPPEPPHAELARRRGERAAADAGDAGSGAVLSPMQGTVVAVEVGNGDEVVRGQVLCVVEAMKMENEIRAHRDGVVSGLAIETGRAVQTGEVLCVLSNGTAET